MFLKLMRRAFNLAIEWELLETSPLTRLQLFNPDNRMENYLSPEQLDKLVTVLRTEPTRTVCNVALFLLATGARLNEALRARGIRSTKKSGLENSGQQQQVKRIRSVPLNDAALEVLRSSTLKATTTTCSSTRRPRSRWWIHKVWGRLRAKPACTGFGFMTYAIASLLLGQ